jgi:hypothetical protein
MNEPLPNIHRGETIRKLPLRKPAMPKLPTTQTTPTKSHNLLAFSSQQDLNSARAYRNKPETSQLVKASDSDMQYMSAENFILTREMLTTTKRVKGINSYEMVTPEGHYMQISKLASNHGTDSDNDPTLDHSIPKPNTTISEQTQAPTLQQFDNENHEGDDLNIDNNNNEKLMESKFKKKHLALNNTNGSGFNCLYTTKLTISELHAKEKESLIRKLPEAPKKNESPKIFDYLRRCESTEASSSILKVCPRRRSLTPRQSKVPVINQTKELSFRSKYQILIIRKKCS